MPKMTNLNYMYTGHDLPWLTGNNTFSFDVLYDYYFKWALSVVFEMIEFENIPETINETFFKYVLYLNGKAVFFKDDDGKLLALNGSPSDRPDIYYIPENVIVSNPRLNKSYNLKRDVECVVVYCTECDKYDQRPTNGGLFTLLSKTATFLADNDISVNVAQKNTRLVNIVSADDQNTYNSIKTVFNKMYRGDPDIVVQSSLVSTLQAVPLTPTATNTYLVQLVELRQYMLSQFYAAVGIATHDNMKKERLITAELNDNVDLVQYNIDNILKTISEGIDKVNEMFGTEITVKLNPLLQPENDTENESSEEEETAGEPTDEESDSDTENESSEEEETAGEPTDEESDSDTENEPSKEEETAGEPTDEESDSDTENESSEEEETAGEPTDEESDSDTENEPSEEGETADIIVENLIVTAEDNAAVKIEIETTPETEEGEQNAGTDNNTEILE